MDAAPSRDRDDTPRSPVSRRTALISAAAGAVALGMAGASPASAAAVPRLPGEVSRLADQRTRGKGALYESIDVRISNDPARIFVPHSVRAGSSTPVGVVWFFHATGSTHTSLSSAFKYPAELALENGAVCICQNLGGSIYTNPKAQTLQRAGWTYLSGLVNVGINFLRANSGGGAMASWTLGAKLMPRIGGLYMANSIYDVEERYAAMPDRIGPAYNYDLDLMRANNPARLPQSAWTSSRIRAVVSDDANPDIVLPPRSHGLALVARAQPVARETTVRTHSLGHQIPGWASTDMISTFGRWAGV